MKTAKHRKLFVNDISADANKAKEKEHSQLYFTLALLKDKILWLIGSLIICFIITVAVAVIFTAINNDVSISVVINDFIDKFKNIF